MTDYDQPARCWEYFDKIYCISLARRKDRRKAARMQFAKVGLSRAVDYYIVEKHPANSEQGIYESQMACIEKGIRSGAERMVIFEDDVVFDGFNPDRILQCVKFLEKNPHWETFFLGCLVSRSWPTSCPLVRRVTYRSLAHAYVLNRPFALELVKKPWSGIPFDAMLQTVATHAYALYPSVAFQSNARSDNSRRKGLEIFRRLFGGLHLIQKMNERFHRYFTAIVLLHFLMVMAAAGWMV